MSLKRNGIFCLIGIAGFSAPAIAPAGEEAAVWESRIDLIAENEPVPGFSGDLKRCAGQDRPCIRVKGKKPLFTIQQYLGGKYLEDLRLSFAFRFREDKTAFHVLLRENGRRDKDISAFQHYALTVMGDRILLKEVGKETKNASGDGGKSGGSASSSASSSPSSASTGEGSPDSLLEKVFPLSLRIGKDQWHEFSVLIEENHLRIFLDGKEAGEASLKDSGGSFQLTHLEGEADYADFRLSEPHPVPDTLKREDTVK